MQDFLKELTAVFEGDIDTKASTKDKYKNDASIFELLPQAVLYPKHSKDISALINLVNVHKNSLPDLSITARSGGTDMSGGAISQSLLIDMTRYFNTIHKVTRTSAHVQPGVFYRDLDPILLKHAAQIGSVPASRNICTVGGMAANNSGGERSLQHGNTENFIKELKVVLRDGNEYTVKPLTFSQLKSKVAEDTFEGKLYKEVSNIAIGRSEMLKKARPHVNKNSMGYNLWSAWDPKTEIFDMTRVIVGSQGTLGIITDITYRLIPKPAHSGLLVAFMTSLDNLGEIIKKVLEHNPTTFEGFDDITFDLGIRYFKGFRKQLGTRNFLRVQKSLLPDIIKFRSKLPNLVLMIEFEGATQNEVEDKIEKMQRDLSSFNIESEIDKNESDSEKFWLIRRASFNLLREKVKTKYASPFIDDLAVNPKYLPEFLPELRKIIKKYNLPATIAGHMGDGNFHIIPLMKINTQSEQHKLRPVMSEVADLVLKYGGTLAGEHNDGMIRGPWLEDVFGKKVTNHFKSVKHLFDPDNIFNPHKKTDASWQFSMAHIRKHI